MSLFLHRKNYKSKAATARVIWQGKGNNDRADTEGERPIAQWKGERERERKEEAMSEDDEATKRLSSDFPLQIC